VWNKKRSPSKGGVPIGTRKLPQVAGGDKKKKIKENVGKKGGGLGARGGCVHRTKKLAEAAKMGERS